MEVLSADNVKVYISSRKFQNEELPVETAMCDYFKGWGNSPNKALCIPSNVVFHIEQVCSYFFIECTTVPMVGTAGIAAEKYSHIKYFPNRASYHDYYDIAMDIC
jgi:hypothetical protein